MNIYDKTTSIAFLAVDLLEDISEEMGSALIWLIAMINKRCDHIRGICLNHHEHLYFLLMFTSVCSRNGRARYLG